MEDDIAVQRLVKMLSAFFTEGISVKEDLTYSLTSEFLQNLQDVLYSKQFVVFSRWETHFMFHFDRIISSPEMYLKYVFYACLQDSRVVLSTFERFLDIFALIVRMSLETRYRSEMNFCKLVPDAFMVFYDKELKKSFRRCKGLGQFVKHINNQKYIESKCIKRNIFYSYDREASINEISKDMRAKALQMIEEDEDLPQYFNFQRAETDWISSSLAQKVLSSAPTEFIPSPPQDKCVNISIYDVMQQNIDKIVLESVGKAVVDLESTSDCSQSLNSDTETNDSNPEHMADDAWYENIIKAVIKHNHAKSSCRPESKGRIQAEADRILEHLKQTTISLLEILDEYNKE